MAEARSELRLKELRSYLQDIETFDNPKLLLGQYPTPPAVAAEILHSINTNYDDIRNKTVADLGCGCGMLVIGAKMLGARHVLGIDIDRDALDISYRNMKELEADIDLLQCDVTTIGIDAVEDLTPDGGVSNKISTFKENNFDTVIMNPPFGTKRNHRIDMEFVRAGLFLAKGAVYSIHRSSTSPAGMKKQAEEMGVNVECSALSRFTLDKLYNKEQPVKICNYLYRFSFK